MRRKDRKINNVKDIEEIIYRADICRLAMCEGDCPYIVPLCFGYESGKLYFHSASQGRKLELLNNNRNVCFEMDVDQELVPEEIPCKWGFRYRSVVGFGKASFIRDLESKREALRIIMRSYSERVFDFTERELAGITMIKVDVEDMKGKISGY
ncbi:MAG: pyridoxamine 5'-phosphate oxidase family protein [Thermodesulfobacteriota bacterium]|nr:pyridoxamine 5'-phosphate oxidase family protein [Thermodesulfobacteriota bacterium]